MKTRQLLDADEILGTKARPAALQRKAPPPIPKPELPEVRPHTGRPTDAEILELAAEGLNTEEIAERLGRLGSYIKRRTEKIHKRLGARNRAHAVALYLRQRKDPK